MKRTAICSLVLLLGGLIATGCGDDEESDDGGAGGTSGSGGKGGSAGSNNDGGAGAVGQGGQPSGGGDAGGAPGEGGTTAAGGSAGTSGSGVTCDEETLDHGTITYDPEARSVGSEATYECDQGYELVGSDPRTCDPDGNWSGAAPSCQGVQCPLIDETGSFGSWDYDPADRRYDADNPSRATFTCDNSGDPIIGVAEVTCQANGTWTGDPESTYCS